MNFQQVYIEMKLLAALAMGVALLTAGSPVGAQTGGRELVSVSGSLFRFGDGERQGVLLVAGEAIAIVDPIDRETASWLAREIDSRFGLPVRYVIYSSDRPDHIGGAEMFSDTAAVVASTATSASLKRRGASVAMPQVTFDDEMLLRLVARSADIPSRRNADIVLSYTRPTDGGGATLVYFPKLDAAYIGDLALVDRLPEGELRGFRIDQWMQTLDEMVGRSFALVIPGHGAVGTGEDLADFASYVSDLHDAVLTEVRAGRSLAETRKRVTLRRFEDWPNYGELESNVAGMYRYVTWFYHGPYQGK